MEAMAWSEVQYKHASLPKLRMKQESNRRDSLSSSRTGDSGYNSDPDISLSPLDFVGPDQRQYMVPLHSEPTDISHSSSYTTNVCVRLVITTSIEGECLAQASTLSRRRTQFDSSQDP